MCNNDSQIYIQAMYGGFTLYATEKGILRSLTPYLITFCDSVMPFKKYVKICMHRIKSLLGLSCIYITEPGHRDYNDLLQPKRSGWPDDE